MSEDKKNYKETKEYKKIRRQVFLEALSKDIGKTIGYYISIPIIAIVLGVLAKVSYMAFMMAWNWIG